MKPVVVVVAALVLAGCAGSPEKPAADAIVETYSQVAYYPACGNEILEWKGETWYPFEPDEQWDVPIVDGPTAGAAGLPAGGRGIATVVSPGPGDDVGDLIVYDGGVAYWVAESKELSTWLTTTEQTYNWEC